MNYKLSKNKTSNLFEVLELNTQKIIFVAENHSKASKIYRNLSKGGGFNGNTPDFFIYKEESLGGEVLLNVTKKATTEALMVANQNDIRVNDELTHK